VELSTFGFSFREKRKMVVPRGELRQFNQLNDLSKSGTLNVPHTIIMLSGAVVPPSWRRDAVRPCETANARLSPWQKRRQ
jgi:hypothetical protein